MKYIRIVLFLLLLSSCLNNTLDEGTLEWQPYRVGDLLIFESSLGRIDSIEVTRIISHLNPNDPLAIIPKKFETLFVHGQLRDSKKEFSHVKQIDLIELHAGEKDNLIYFNEGSTLGTLSYPTTILSTGELKEKLNGKEHIEIKAESGYNQSYEYDYDLQSFEWSKKHGYTRYTFKNGYYLDLKEFIRNGNNILNK